MAVGDVDLRFLADLDASVERRGTLCRQHTARAAVEHAKAERRVPGRFARPVEAVVVFLVSPDQRRAALEEHRAKLGVVALAGDAKLELRFDGAVSRSAQTPARHAGRVTVTRRSFASDKAKRLPPCIHLRRTRDRRTRRCDEPPWTGCLPAATGLSRRQRPPGAP